MSALIGFLLAGTAEVARGQCLEAEFAKLTASDAAANNEFGRSVSIQGDLALVGAYELDGASTYAGAGYVYRFDATNWNQQAKLTASDAATLDAFGQAVAVSDGVAVIGAYTDDDAGGASGSAYVYRFNGTDWFEQTKLTASDAAQGDSFGYGVAIDDLTVVIGAIHDQDAGLSTGAAYVYRFDGAGWTEQAKLVASDAAAGDRFGMSVSISGAVGLCGAWGNDDDGIDSGSAYLFRGLSDCNANNTLDMCDMANGTSPDDNANGVPDECEAGIPALSAPALLAMALLLAAAGAILVARRSAVVAPWCE